jgi:hypothetical protein
MLCTSAEAFNLNGSWPGYAGDARKGVSARLRGMDTPATRVALQLAYSTLMHFGTY